MIRRLASVVFILATATGCIVVPNLIPIKKPLTIRKVEAGKSDREDVLRILGKPQVVDTPGLYVYAWERASAFAIVYQADVPLGLRATRAIVEFDAEGNVVRVESSWDETEPKLPVVSCRREIPGCAKRNRLISSGIGVTALEFTPDGEGLAVCTWVHRWGSCILDPSDGRLLTRLDFTTPYSYGNTTPPSYLFATMSFSEDGNLLAAANGSRLVVLDTSDGTERMSVCPAGKKSCFVHGDSAALSPDGTRVAFRQRNKGLVIRHLEGGEIVSEADAIGPVFSPDGSLIAGRLKNGGLAILDSITGAAMGIRSSKSKSRWRLRAVAFSPDGRYLAMTSCAHLEIHRVDDILTAGSFDQPEAVVLLPIPRTSGLSCWPQALFSPDGSQLAALTADTLTRFAVPSGTVVSKVRFKHTPTAIAIDPGLNRMALATGDKLRICELEDPSLHP